MSRTIIFREINNSVSFEIKESYNLEMPQFPGGEQKLMEYLSKTVRYPVDALEQNITGKVICQFVVDTDGTISDIVVVRSVRKILANEAVRVIKAMPKGIWIPGKLEGIPVRVRFTLPVVFRMNK
jgi:protein TonB